MCLYLPSRFTDSDTKRADLVAEKGALAREVAARLETAAKKGAADAQALREVCVMLMFVFFRFGFVAGVSDACTYRAGSRCCRFLRARGGQ